MTAIPEHLEEPTPDVSPSLPQPAIQQPRDVPIPLQVDIPEPDSFINPLGTETSVFGAPFEPRRQTHHRWDQMELASPGQSPTHLNSWPQPAQEGSRPASRPNSFIVDPRLRNGLTPSTRVHDLGVGNETPRLYRQNTLTSSIGTAVTSPLSVHMPFTGTQQPTMNLNSIGNVVVDSQKTFNLLALLGRTDKVRNWHADFTAISPSGTYAVIVSKKDIRLFCMHHDSPRPFFVASGSFSFKKNNYYYGTAQLDPQQPLPPSDWMRLSSFTHMALSDEHLAIATTEKMFIFGVGGERKCRWLFYDRIQNGIVKGLAFSPDGSKLVAVYSFQQRGEEPYEAARFYTAAEFRSDAGGQVKGLQNAPHWQQVTWQLHPNYQPRRLAFSWKGNMLAIATNHSDGEARIRILGENGGGSPGVWSYWGERSIRVHNPERPHDMVGEGVTGMSLYSLDLNVSDFSLHNDDCVAISLDTTDAAAHDCYRIKNKGRVYELEKFTQIASGSSGTKNMAIAVSQAHDAVALLTKDSINLLTRISL